MCNSLFEIRIQFSCTFILFHRTIAVMADYYLSVSPWHRDHNSLNDFTIKEL